jgi:diguanylate cyclase (GGDEF)-like protein
MSRRPNFTSSRPSAAADQRLERVERHFRLAERMAGIGTWRMTIADSRIEWSDQVFAIHALDVGVAPDLETALAFYPPAARDAVAETIARATTTGEPFDIENDLVTAQGDRRRVRSVGEIELIDGVPVAVIGIIQDISAWHAIEQRLRDAAATDHLTGMPNRGAFKHYLDERIAACRSTGVPLALLLIDLDGFKAVNDAFGHPTGDEVLREVASELCTDCRPDCFAARIGGDEFAIVVAGHAGCARIDATIADLQARLRRSVQRDDRIVEVSASIGGAWLDAEVDGGADLTARADAALYEAKRQRPGSAWTFGRDGIDDAAPERRRTLTAVA